jgi:hypothetical protein
VKIGLTATARPAQAPVFKTSLQKLMLLALDQIWAYAVAQSWSLVGGASRSA